MKKCLDMKPPMSGPISFHEKRDKRLQGRCATHLDDTLHAGNLQHCGFTKQTETKVQCRERQRKKIQSARVHINSMGKDFSIDRD